MFTPVCGGGAFPKHGKERGRERSRHPYISSTARQVPEALEAEDKLISTQDHRAEVTWEQINLELNTLRTCCLHLCHTTLLLSPEEDRSQPSFPFNKCNYSTQ